MVYKVDLLIALAIPSKILKCVWVRTLLARHSAITMKDHCFVKMTKTTCIIYFNQIDLRSPNSLQHCPFLIPFISDFKFILSISDSEINLDY